MLASVIAILIQQANVQAAEEPDQTFVNTALEIVNVRATADQTQRASIPGISSLNAQRLLEVAPTHANELFDEIPGVWISRGSGQEQLTAIRSPVLTGPGACGAFMVMEDGVPIRPSGFCNVNELFEVNILQAKRVDVVRGPGSVIYGSNALHGVIDISSADPAGTASGDAGIQIGSDDYYRARASVGNQDILLSANYTDAGSFRVDEGFKQGFANLLWLSNYAAADVRTQFSWADLDQDTAGFIFGKDAYRDPVLRTQNLNPEAFRKVRAFRVSSRWSWEMAENKRFETIFYARNSDMDFLQHFLPGKPLEENGQRSAGVQLSWSRTQALNFGIDLEWADGYLVEFQENPTEGSGFLVETRPAGFHYDYDVRSLTAAAWAQYEYILEDNLNLTVGLRAELLDYDYRNNMLNGNTRDDGSECGFGGCLYTRPADRSDQFTNLAPEIGFNWTLNADHSLFTRLARGFRAPQATELYRLQRGQRVADLRSETIDTFEIGWRARARQVSWDTTVFAMHKDNSIFRDANGFNVSDGQTEHYGVEANLDWQINDYWRLGANLSYAIHQYRYNRPISGVRDGNDVDTAPRWLGGARLQWQPLQTTGLELEWVHMGEYFLEPANARRYKGHDLFNLRLSYALPGSPHQWNLRVSNLFSTLYAERADFAFGNYRYFPGAERRVFLEWSYRVKS